MNLNIYALTGSTLGQFDLIELIGSGGMGAVYLADQPSLNRKVAVKILAPDLAVQPNYLRRFNREAQTVASLEHPHIVHLYDYGMENGISFLAMQLLSGGTLSQQIVRPSDTKPSLWTLHEVARLISQLAGALDYAHSRKVIHRDIKPSNIMFDQHGNAYLVDFGIAKLLEATSSLTVGHVPLGTPTFMAPEQWKAEPPSPATDQYALGIVAYLLVSGKAPFEAPTPYGLMHRHLNDAPTPLHVCRPDIPAAVSEIIGRSIAKNPNDRFSSITAFADALAQTLPQELPAEAFVRRNAESYIGGEVQGDNRDSTRPDKPTPSMIVPAPLDQDSQATNIGVSSTGATNLVDANVRTAWPSFLDELPVVSISTPQPSQVMQSPPAPAARKSWIRARWPLWLITFLALAGFLLSDALNSNNKDSSEELDAMSELAQWKTGMAKAIAWSPDGITLAVVASSGLQLYQADNPSDLGQKLAIYGEAITSVAWSPDGTQLAYAGARKVSIWDAATGTSSLVGVHTSNVKSVAWSPDGMRLASGSGDGTVQIWDVASGESQLLHGHKSTIHSIVWSPDGVLLASASADSIVRVSDVTSGDTIHILIGHTNYVLDVAWSFDGTRLASAGADGTIRIWDAGTGEVQDVLQGQGGWISSVAWSPDGSSLASGSVAGSVDLWDVARGEIRRSLTGHRLRVTEVIWSSDGTRLISGSMDGTIRLWGRLN